MGFEPLPKVWFRIERDKGIERIVIPARRSWFALIFLPIWLVLWSVGGVVVMSQAMAGQDVAFSVVWLILWFFGILFALGWLGWQISGKETLSIEPGALVRGWKLLGFGRQKRYDLTHVKNLSAAAPPFPFAMMQVSVPPFLPMTFGSVKWAYGAATIYACAGLTEAEGEMIVEHLKPKLPIAAQ